MILAGNIDISPFVGRSVARQHIEHLSCGINYKLATDIALICIVCIARLDQHPCPALIFLSARTA